MEDGDLVIYYTDSTFVNLGPINSGVLDATYTVVFIADGKTVGTAKYTAENTTITEPAIPEKEGYTGEWEEYTLAVGDRTIEAIYTPNEYRVTLTVEGSYGEVEGGDTYSYGEKVDISATPYPSYTFAGWYNGGELISGEANYSFAMPAGNIEYVAKFEVRDDMAPFTYVAGKDFCIITGVKDFSVTELIVPDCVTDIETSAFSNCSSLTTLTLPFADRNLGYYWSPYGSNQDNSRVPNSLKTIILSEGVTEIADNAFAYCNSLTDIVIPSTLEIVGENAFESCSNLKNVHITDLASWCSIYFKDNLSTDRSIYYNGDIIIDLVIPDGVATVGNAFAFYNKLESVVIPDSVYNISEAAFSYCTGLETVSFGKNVVSIGEYAFSNCSSLLSVVLPEGITDIPAWAFNNCTGITSLVIPSSVTQIGPYAFDFTPANQMRVYYGGTQADWANINISSINYAILHSASCYYYSESEPTDSGNYWHWAEDGVTPVAW